jgi:DNA-binding Lrp family transcriptional regulator
LTIRIFVLVDLYEGADRLEAFSRRLAAASEVSEINHVSGKLDLLLRLDVENMRDYGRFVDTFLTGDANVRESRALYVLKTVKMVGG